MLGYRGPYRRLRPVLLLGIEGCVDRLRPAFCGFVKGLCRLLRQVLLLGMGRCIDGCFCWGIGAVSMVASVGV